MLSKCRREGYAATTAGAGPYTRTRSPTGVRGLGGEDGAEGCRGALTLITGMDVECSHLAGQDGSRRQTIGPKISQHCLDQELKSNALLFSSSRKGCAPPLPSRREQGKAPSDEQI